VFVRKTRAENHAEVRAKLQSFQAERSAPVSLEQLLENIPAADIEKKIVEKANSAGGGNGGKAISSLLSTRSSRALENVLGQSSSSSTSESSARRTAAAVHALKDHELRQEIRHALLHQTNSLTALDSEAMSSSFAGSTAASIREHQHQMQQLISPFANSGESGLTLTPFASAQSQVSAGMGSTFQTQTGMSANKKGASASSDPSGNEHLPTHGSLSERQAGLQSTMHQFSHMPQRIFAVPSAAGTNDAKDFYPGMVDVFRPRHPSSSSGKDAQAQQIETQLQKAYAAGGSQKWINKFSMDVPGIDVLFDSSLPSAAAVTTPLQGSLTRPLPMKVKVDATNADRASRTTSGAAAKHGRRAAAQQEGKRGSGGSLNVTSRRSLPARVEAPTVAPAAAQAEAVVRVESSSSPIHTRAFLLRPGDTSGAGAVKENQLDLGLEVANLPDVRALQPPVRVELETAPTRIHSEAHVAMVDTTIAEV
jgi:hypothetical protein